MAPRCLSEGLCVLVDVRLPRRDVFRLRGPLRGRSQAVRLSYLQREKEMCHPVRAGSSRRASGWVVLTGGLDLNPTVLMSSGDA